MSAGFVSSNQRPIPLKGRPDLRMQNVQYLGVTYCVVKDPVGLQYHRLQEEQYRALELMNGERSLEQIRDDLREDYPTLRLTLSDVQQLITDLHKKGLLHSDRAGQAGALVKEREKTKREKFMQQLKSLLYLRLPGWDPERTLQIMYPFTKFLYHPVVVFLCMVFVACSWILLGVNFQAFHSKLPEFQQFFAWPNLMYMWVALGGAKIIHEFGHGLSCKHYGGECHEMGVMLLVFSPCLYCDVTDSWMLKNKWQRIIIAAAGMYIEVILSGIAIFVWWNTNTGLLHHLALNVFFVTTVTTVIFNANPLMRFDGYYMMSDFLEIPNLRAKSDKLLRESFGWYCLGIEPQPDPFMPETGKAWFVAYAIAAWLYRWVILLSISLFLYTVLKPYDLQSIGITLCVVSMWGIFYSMGKNLYQLINAPRIEPLSKTKITLSLAVVGAVVAAIMMIPIPWHIETPLLLEPREVSEVYVPIPGQCLTPKKVAEIAMVDAAKSYSVVGELENLGLSFTKRVKPGDHVEAGQVLAVIENVMQAAELQSLHNQRNVITKKIENFEKIKDLDKYAESQIPIAKANLQGVKRDIAKLKTQLAEGIVRAKISGTVIAPPIVPEPKLDDTTRTKLPNWYGSPLDDRNAECFLEKGAHLLSIAPDSNFEAMLYVDQADNADVKVGDACEVKFDSLPDKIYKVTLADLSPQGEYFAPETLTTKFGGSMPTAPDAEGKEILVSPAVQGTVLLTEDTHLLRTGMRGYGRFVMDKRTIGAWIWRYVRRTFHFRL